jgi:NitT/TauT family transport system substrate-binding protein
MRATWNRGRVRTTALKLGVAAIALALVAACGSDDSDNADDGSGLTHVKVSFLKSDSFIPLQAGIELGIFKKHGLDIEFVDVSSGTALVTTVAEHLADWTFSVAIGATASAISNGMDIEVSGMSIPVGTGFYLMSKAGSGIESVEDLKGKKIGVSKAGSVTDSQAQYTNAKYNLDAEIVPVGTAGTVPALLSGNLDAIVTSGPQSYDIVASGEAIKLLDYAEEMPQQSLWVTNKGFMDDKKSHDIAVRMMDAWMETVAYLKAHPDEGKQFYVDLIDSTPENAEKAYQTMADTRLTPDVTPEDIQQSYDLLKVSGTDISKYPSPEEMSISYGDEVEIPAG